jgi:hypothetical protein
VASDLPLLLTPSPGEGAPSSWWWRSPKEGPAGLLPGVPQAQGGGRRSARRWRWRAIRDLEARVPREVYGGSLRLLLRNRGNVTERVHLAQAEGSEVGGETPWASPWPPGEEREVALSLSGFRPPEAGPPLRGEAGPSTSFRSSPKGGSPLPYTLQGRLEGSLGQGPPAFRLSLEGPPLPGGGGGVPGGGRTPCASPCARGPGAGGLACSPPWGGEVGYREGPPRPSPWPTPGPWNGTYTPGETYRPAPLPHLPRPGLRRRHLRLWG